MPSTESSFRQLAPFTVRVPAIDYFAIPLPGQYDAPQYPYQQPQVKMTCVSQGGTATLCGFSEYTSPSTPPKKYLNQAFSGGGSFDLYGPADCSGAMICNISDLWSGVMEYSPSDCSQSGTGHRSRIGSNSPCGNSEEDFSSIVGVYSDGALDQITTQTQISLTAGPGCRAFTGGGGAVIWSPTPLIQQTLSTEDTEANAIARASTTPGESCTAFTESRLSGFSFDFATVAYDIACSSLIRNARYRLSYDLVTEDYGGGNAVTLPVSRLFRADAATQHFTGNLEAESGKQVSIQNIAIEQLTVINSGLSGGGLSSDENHAFRELAPFTPRFVGIDYMAVPAPGNPPRGDSAYPYNYPP